MTVALETTRSIVPLLAVLVSVLGAILVVILGRYPNWREGASLTAGLIKFGLVMSMLPAIFKGTIIEYQITEFFPGGLGIAFRVDGLGFLFGATASFLWMITTVYSIGYMRSLDEKAQTRFYICFAVSLSAALGVAFAANLFTLFLFYEILTFVTYPLVIHHETAEAYAGGRKYLAYLVGTSKTFLLMAIILTYGLTGTLQFRPGGVFSPDINPLWVTAIYILFLAGLTKAAMMPLHNWLPTAMVAPVPVSALLHAVAVVKVGVFSIVRIMLDIFGVDLLQRMGLGIPTAYFVSVTILLASIIALKQDNLKLRLAYSTVSQLSYVVLGAALLTPAGIKGSVMQIVAHAFAKITLFFCAGSIYVALHKKNVSELSGIGRQMPWTMGAFTIGALSLIGVPPLAGFMSKWWLAVGSIEAHSFLVLFVLLSSALLNAGYFLPIIYKAYFEMPGTVGAQFSMERHEAPRTMVIPLVITAILTILAGIYSDRLMDLVKQLVNF